MFTALLLRDTCHFRKKRVKLVLMVLARFFHLHRHLRIIIRVDGCGSNICGIFGGGGWGHVIMCMLV